jgi:hypothetical protein
MSTTFCRAHVNAAGTENDMMSVEASDPVTVWSCIRTVALFISLRHAVEISSEGGYNAVAVSNVRTSMAQQVVVYQREWHHDFLDS